MPLVHDLSFRDLLKCFTTAELMRWSHIKEMYESELRTGLSATGVFEQATDEGKKRWEDLRKRVVEHVSAFSRNFGLLCCDLQCNQSVHGSVSDTRASG